MSAPRTTRRVAVFTLFLFTVWLAAANGASAMRPEPPASATRGHSHHVPGAASSGADVATWLLVPIAVLAVVAIAAGVAASLRRHHLRSPTHAVT